MVYSIVTESKKIGLPMSSAATQFLLEKEILASELPDIVGTCANGKIGIQDIKKCLPDTTTALAKMDTVEGEVLTIIQTSLIATVKAIAVEIAELEEKQHSLIFRATTAVVAYLQERKETSEGVAPALTTEQVLSWIKSHVGEIDNWNNVKTQLSIAIRNAFMVINKHKGMYLDDKIGAVLMPSNMLNPEKPDTVFKDGKLVPLVDAEGTMKTIPNTDTGPVRPTQYEQKELWNGAACNPNSGKKRAPASGTGDVSGTIMEALDNANDATAFKAVAKYLQGQRDNNIKLNEALTNSLVDIMQALQDITNQSQNKDWVDANGWFVGNDEVDSDKVELRDAAE